MKQLAITLLVALSMAAPALPQQTGTTTLSVSISAAAEITISTANTALTSSGTTFSDYTGSTSISYKIRTTLSGGAGSLTLQITSDFSPAGGPEADSDLTFRCTGSGAGTTCSGSHRASTTSALDVLSFGANARSTASGDTASVTWTLPNKPSYQTGSYSATATFTISAS